MRRWEGVGLREGESEREEEEQEVEEEEEEEEEKKGNTDLSTRKLYRIPRSLGVSRWNNKENVCQGLWHGTLRKRYSNCPINLFLTSKALSSFT